MDSIRRMAGGLSVVERAQDRAARGVPATLVLLHGFGKYYGHLLDLWSKLDVECPVVAVQAGFRIGPSAYRWFAYEDRPDGSVAIATDEERCSREALVSYLDARRMQDPEQQLFLFGHSQGGMMALSVAFLRPDIVDGCAVLNSRILPETWKLLPARPDLGGMPVFVGHGVADAVVRVEKGRRARDTLAGHGAKLTYREYDSAHEISLDMVTDVAEWLRMHLPERHAGGARS